MNQLALLSGQAWLFLFVIPEGNPRFARIGKTSSGREPLWEASDDVRFWSL
jgi:hypothetical protein